MEIRHDRPSQKRVYLRLELDEAKHLRDEIAAVIEEREAWIEHITPECDHEPIQTYNDGSFWCAKCDREVRP